MIDMGSKMGYSTNWPAGLSALSYPSLSWPTMIHWQTISTISKRSQTAQKGSQKTGLASNQDQDSKHKIKPGKVNAIYAMLVISHHNPRKWSIKWSHKMIRIPRKSPAFLGIPAISSHGSCSFVAQACPVIWLWVKTLVPCSHPNSWYIDLHDLHPKECTLASVSSWDTNIQSKKPSTSWILPMPHGMLSPFPSAPGACWWPRWSSRWSGWWSHRADSTAPAWSAEPPGRLGNAGEIHGIEQVTSRPRKKASKWL